MMIGNNFGTINLEGVLTSSASAKTLVVGVRAYYLEINS